jgi:sugar lactone lactonase YvrE
MNGGNAAEFEAQPLPVPPSLLGESPFWHPADAALYWCDIPGKALHRYQPSSGAHRAWTFDCEPCSMAPLLDGCLLVAMRDGLWRFDPASGKRQALAEPPYDPTCERFNDGKADAQGRFWVGTVYEPREPALGALYCWTGGRLARMAGDVTVSNGLAWSPDGRRMYWSDTKTHRIDVLDTDPADGSLSNRRLFRQFEPKQPGQALEAYGGRPDGAAVDSQGCYWSAMFEGQRLLRLSPDGEVLREVSLPVRCATMACFGDADLKTLYITTARERRPAEELAAQPWAGQVLRMRVDVAGLPVNFALG